MKNNLLFWILLPIVPLLGFTQDSLNEELQYDVHRIYPYISITPDQLNEALTLTDLHCDYKSSWIKEYVSVEILTSHNGKVKQAVGKNDTLTHEQKDFLNAADVDKEISVNVHYIPENTLSHNEVKKMDFTLTIDPQQEAIYPGGQDKLKQYLKEKAIDKIPEGSFNNYDLVAIKFTIDEDGQIIDAHVFQSVYQTYINEEIDELLLEAICNMPTWKPAEYANGIKTKQEFVLLVGNPASCLTNLIRVPKN